MLRPARYRESKTILSRAWTYRINSKRLLHESKSRRSASRYPSSLTPVILIVVAGVVLYTQNGGTFDDGLRRKKLRADSSKTLPGWPKGAPVIGNPHDGSRSSDADPHQPGQQHPPPQTRVVVDGREEDPLPKACATEDSIWQAISAKISVATESVSSVQVSSIGEKISDLIIPDWIRLVPGFLTKLQNELSMAPGSLAEEIWHEAHDPEINPEIIWEARVRVSDSLCEEEKIFLDKRKKVTTRALARYLNIPEQEIHPDDVPTIAMCGSGGGLRALVAGSSSYLCAKEAGLFDCITFTAGVSGSTWLQTLYYSTITGQCHQQLINHLKHRLGVHIAYPPEALSLLSSAPTNKYLLSGIIEKFKGVPDADFGIVDIYGLLLAARLMVPKGELGVDDYDLKISNQRRYVDYGEHPLPIYTAVRHEIPIEEQINKDPATAQAKAKQEAWFQWFEFTPYEFWCEELEAGIPMWAIGRKFEHGKTVWRENGLALPELRVPLLLGIWGSAFCATLSHYYKEIQPFVTGLAGLTELDKMVAERDDDLVRVHPIDPATIPNYVLGLKGQLPASCPESMFTATNLQLMDAGMSNNLPIYPLLRPGRDVDILIAFDASADVRTDNWLKVADGYARQRGIKGWPIGAGWPSAEASKEQVSEELEAAQAASEQEAHDRMTGAREEQRNDSDKMRKKANTGGLGYCNVWVGTVEQRTSDSEPPPSKLVEEDWELMRPEAGITLIYFPFIANPKVDGVDPRTSDFMSTWNFVYTPDQIDKVVALARANFEEGKEQTRRTVRAVYERKKAKRLEREQEEKRRRRQWKMRMGIAGKKLGEGDHANQFS